MASLRRYLSTWQGPQGWGRGLPQPLPEHVAGGLRAGGVASLSHYLSTWQGPQGWGRGLPQPLPVPVSGAAGLGAWLLSSRYQRTSQGRQGWGRWRLVPTEACAPLGRGRRPALVFLFFGPASLQTGQAPSALCRLMTDFPPVPEERAVWFTS